MKTSDETPTLLKAPASHEDFSAEWTDYLAPDSDTLESLVSVSITPNLGDPHLKLLDPPNPPGGGSYGISTNSNGQSFSYAWLAGGVAGKSYVVSFVVQTVGGRTAEQSIRIKVQNL